VVAVSTQGVARRADAVSPRMRNPRPSNTLQIKDGPPPMRNPICGRPAVPECFVRTSLVPFLALLAALASLPAHAGPLGDEKPKVPAEADRVLTSVAAAFRAGDAEGVCARMDTSRDARVFLSLKGVDSKSYTREQATELLKTQYFPKRRIVAMKATDECAGCGEWGINRAYVMTYRVGDKEFETPLAIALERRKVTGEEYAWFLTSLKEG
jgi:hypothetical protein